jgi:hypothetical protein
MSDGTEATVITGKENIAIFRLLTLRAALRLELKGLRRRGESAFSIIKREFNLSGNKESVLEQFNQLVEQRQAEKSAKDAAVTATPAFSEFKEEEQATEERPPVDE